MKNYTDFKNKLNELDKKVYRAFADEEGGRGPIYDGALNTKKYFELSSDNLPKIMWLMKEPYDEADGTGGDWSFSEEFASGRFPKNLVHGGSKPTWHPVCLCSLWNIT